MSSDRVTVMLERKLFEKIRAGKKLNLEKAMLISYGYDDEKKIAQYRTQIIRLNKIFRKFASKELKVRRKTARALYNFLWQNPTIEVYKAMHAFRLGKDKGKRNLEEDEKVGECVRRTIFYSLIGFRQGLDMKALYNGCHVLSRLRLGKRFLDIENTPKEGFNGFDIQTQGGHRRAYEGLKEGSLIDLIGLTYKNRGVIEMDNKHWRKAIIYYDKAIEIIPNYAAVYFCRGEAKENLGWIRKAIEDYDRAIEIDPRNINTYENRGKAKLKIKDEEGAERDLKKSRRLMDALMNRRRLSLY